jgi:acyl-CoA synthetase (NDP forming)
VSSIEFASTQPPVSIASQRYLLEPEAIQLLNKYRITYPDHALVHNADEAALEAERLGFPIVLKIVSPDVIHKSDISGVLLDLASPQQVRAGFDRLLKNVLTHQPDAGIEGVLVCKQAPPGLEVIVGGLDDPTFGPTVMFGMGGIFAELFSDVTFRIAPLHRPDALEMIHEVKGYPLIAGLRGQKPLDEEALMELLLAVSQLISDHGEIKELDLNPVRLYEQGLQVLDVRVIT